MTPAGRLAAAIDLLAEIETDARPADAVANSFFRNRRFIGGGDRREVSTLVWGVLRARRHLGWWLDKFGARATPRLLLAAQAIFTGMTPHKIALAFTSGQYGPPPLDDAERATLERFAGHTLHHPNMPPAVTYEVPDWVLPRFAAQFGDRLEAEMAALAETAPLDLRVNILKATPEDAAAALRRENLSATPMRFSPWGLRLAGRQSVTQGAAFRDGLVEIQDEGSQLVALLVGAEPGMRVADYCAGAGGKTLAIAMTMGEQGPHHRLRRVRAAPAGRHQAPAPRRGA